MNKPRIAKRTVRQNRWGNWRGYEGGRFSREFALEPAFLVAAPQIGPVGQSEMPEEAQEWLKEGK